MKKELKDYLHYYLGCMCDTKEGFLKLRAVYADESPVFYDSIKEIPYEGVLPVLRHHSSLTFDEWKIIAEKILIVPGDCISFRHRKENDWFTLIRITKENITSGITYMKKENSLTYGVDRFSDQFISIELQSSFINELRKLHIDCDGLIESCNAIELQAYNKFKIQLTQLKAEFPKADITYNMFSPLKERRKGGHTICYVVLDQRRQNITPEDHENNFSPIKNIFGESLIERYSMHTGFAKIYLKFPGTK